LKNLLLVFSLLIAVFLSSAFAQIAQTTAIKDVQYTTDPSGDSPMNGQVVTISGVITAEPYAFGGSRYFVQDSSGAWSGVMVYDKGREVAEGDHVTLTATVSEYHGVTEMTNVTDFTIDSTGVGGIEPTVVTTGEIATGGTMAEAYEGCLIKVENLTITNADLGHGEWEIDDGSGPCRVDDAAPYFFDPSQYTNVVSITGVLDYSYSNTKIQPRLANDVIESGPYTRMQRIQQVRYSDLIKAGVDAASDTSYMVGDTVTVKGIVTMPSGLSFAGAGIKFIFSAPEGGPWSAILSYNADSTAYPVLYEGDEIEMTGYIGEYHTGDSHMTEFWITSPINILSVGNAIPAADSVATGDLRWPTTAEQWGNVMVRVGNATVVDVTPQYEMFAVDDGTGSVLVDDDSDSLANYPKPPLGAVAESIRGWIYNHYGSLADSNTYKLEPLYTSDIVWGAGPPAIRNAMRDKGIPTSSDAVVVTAKVETNLAIAAVTVNYKVGEGEYTQVAMTDQGDGNFSAEIPAQPEGSFVSYYIQAEDEIGQTTTEPADIEMSNFCYVVRDGAVSIADVQYTPWKLADSPFNGYEVAVEGVVTVDTTFYNKFGAYAIQDAEGAWNGVFIFGAFPALFPGDMVKVKGTVSDYNADWHFKWDNNTVILADSLTIESQGNAVPEIHSLTTGELSGDSDTAESFEGCLVKVSNFTLTSVNAYDVTIDDGSGPCLLDADAFVGRDQDPNPYFFIDGADNVLIVGGDTVSVGETMSLAQGVFTFSFGSYKIEIRNSGDVGVVTGVNNDFVAQPLKYALEQNFPNPFNPETRIYFELPQTQQVTLVVYNMRGQQVRTLVDQRYTAGRHIINWDGRNNSGVLVPSGVYIYRIKAGDFIDYKKMTLLK